MCVRYQYSNTKRVVLVTFIIDNRVILVISFLVLIRYVCHYRHRSSLAVCSIPLNAIF